MAKWRLAYRPTLLGQSETCFAPRGDQRWRGVSGLPHLVAASLVPGYLSLAGILGHKVLGLLGICATAALTIGGLGWLIRREIASR